MTVELALAFPLFLALALVVTNVGWFLSDCASFDRVVRQGALSCCASPASGDDGLASLAAALDREFDRDNLEVGVSLERDVLGMTHCRATLRFVPTLFGGKTVDSAFGLVLPRLEHLQEFSLDAYKPGVLL